MVWFRSLFISFLILGLAPCAHLQAADLFQQCLAPLKRISFGTDPRLVPKENGGLKVSMLPPESPDTSALQFIPALYGRLMGIPAISEAYKTVQKANDDRPLYTKWTEGFGVTVSPNPEAQSRIPKEGGLLVVSNHPLFGVDGAAIAQVIETVRTDVKVVMTDSFETIPEMKDHAIFVSVKNTPEGRAKNMRVMRESMAWLKQGHVLVIFPSGSPSGVVREGVPVPLDLPWSSSIGSFVNKTGAKAMPVYVEGTGSPLYLFLRKHDRTRPYASMRLLNEIGLIRGKDIPITFGEPVSEFGFLAPEGGKVDPADISQFLRDQTYQLGGIPTDLSRVNPDGTNPVSPELPE